MFEYDFNEVALTLGALAGKQQNIALISGVATINIIGRGRDMLWDIDGVVLHGPILHDPDVSIVCGHPLWEAVVASIERACGDEIYDEAREACRPDPDRPHDDRMNAP